jgi:hypothetical protein
MGVGFPHRSDRPLWQGQKRLCHLVLPEYDETYLCPGNVRANGGK